MTAGVDVAESCDELAREKGAVRGMTTKVDEVGEDVYVCPSGEVVLPDEISNEAGEERSTIEWAHLKNKTTVRQEGEAKDE